MLELVFRSIKGHNIARIWVGERFIVAFDGFNKHFRTNVPAHVAGIFSVSRE